MVVAERGKFAQDTHHHPPTVKLKIWVLSPNVFITGNARSNSNGMGPNMGRLTLRPVPTDIRISLN